MLAPPHRGMGHCFSCLSPQQAQPPPPQPPQPAQPARPADRDRRAPDPDGERDPGLRRRYRNPQSPPGERADLSNRSEMNDGSAQHRVRRKSSNANGDYVPGSLQCSLLPDDPYVNGNRKNSSPFGPYSASPQDGAATLAHPTPILAAAPDKSQKSFYHKINPPRSVFGMGSGESKSSDARIDALFERYRDPDEDAILTDGIEKLCEDLQLRPDEFRVLVLAWKLNAEQMCRFSRAEFCQGLRAMRVDSIKGIQARLPEIVCELRKDDELFRDLYRFTFKFGLDVVSGQRILPADVAVVLWRLVFTVCEPPILNEWLDYLVRHPHIRGIPKDTWYMFLNFAEMVGTDLGSYDDTEAWPSLFDDFVEYENDQMNQNISKSDNCRISD